MPGPIGPNPGLTIAAHARAATRSWTAFPSPYQSTRTRRRCSLAAVLVGPARAAQLLPVDELHPVRLLGEGSYDTKGDRYGDRAR